MNKITYLFGAGASKHALPIVNEIPERIKDLIDILEKEEFSLSSDNIFQDLESKVKKTKRELQLEMIDSLKWMLKESRDHASIDTFAKKLYVKRKHKDLEKLKATMSVFFNFEQTLNKPDFRYDSFYASILKSGLEFPENIRIVSWNYDYQFELALSSYTDDNDISSNQSRLGVKAKYIDERIGLKGFGIFKLNGSAGLHTDKGFREYFYATDLTPPLKPSFVENMTRNYAAAMYFETVSPSLSFAWEPDYDGEKNIVIKTLNNIQDTIALVVIGYSFPFFNRDIDRMVIGSMKNLKKVYIQAPDANIIMERFQAIRDDLEGVKIIPKFDVGQFLLPNEL